MKFSITEPPEHSDSELGRKLFAGPCDFVKGVVDMSGLPPGDRLEVAFAGRSNVGKSSLINALTGRKALARTSSTPGRTQEVNYFALGEAHYLVDLPGYGFANAPVAVVGKWQRLLKAYLSGRASLRRAFLLVDGRHGFKSADREIMALLDSSAVTFQVVLTKCDKPKSAEMDKIVASVFEELRNHPAAYPEVMQTSSVKGSGIDVLRAEIATLE